MHAFVTGIIVNMIVFVFTVSKKLALFFIYMHIHILKTLFCFIVAVRKKDIGWGLVNQTLLQRSPKSIDRATNLFLGIISPPWSYLVCGDEMELSPVIWQDLVHWERFGCFGKWKQYIEGDHNSLYGIFHWPLWHRQHSTNTYFQI